MINLSNKAAKRFNVKWADLQERSGDRWKVDVVMLGRVPILLIVHEFTLYTLVRRKSQFHSPLDIADEIVRCCPWYRSDISPALGRNADRRIVGSITEMKRQILGAYSPDDIVTVENLINGGLYSYLSAKRYEYGRPVEAVMQYENSQMPWL